MALTIVSSIPSSGDTEVYINKPISVTFDITVNSTTLHQGTVNLIDTSTSVSLPISLKLDPVDNKKIVISPGVYLKTNTVYRLIIVGSDQALGVQLEASNGELLETTIYIEFTTGISVYNVDVTVEKDVADKSLEGDLFLPSNIKALGYDFTITKARPKNHSCNNATTLTGDNTIRFTFSKGLLSGQDYSTWADIDTCPILNDVRYLASGSSLDSTVTIPNYELGVIGNEFIIQFSGELPKNLSVSVLLNNNITASDGTEYPGNFEYSFVTQIIPSISGPEVIKREIRPIASYFSDDYIIALLFKNAIWLWERLGRSMDLSNLPYAANKYVIYATLLDLIEDADLSKWLKSGVRRRLGDFSVEVDTYLGKGAIKAAKLEKMKDIALETLVKGWQFRVGISTVGYEDAIAEVSRLWYNVNNRYLDPLYKFYQEDIPATNTTTNRWAKTNNPWW